MVTLHEIVRNIGIPMALVIYKAHFVSGCDYVSKCGTKKAALKLDPVRHLHAFGNDNNLDNSMTAIVESYLTRVWAGLNMKTEATSFDKLRLEIFSSSSYRDVTSLPPTSSVMRGHISRCFFLVRNMETLLLENCQELNPLDYEWENQGGCLMPIKHLNLLPDDFLGDCGCQTNCSTNSCGCRKACLACVRFCHKKSILPCENC